MKPDYYLTEKEISRDELNSSLNSVLSDFFNDFRIIRINIQYNSINGILFIEKNKCFLKILNKGKNLGELEGYKLLKGWPIPFLKYIIGTKWNFLFIYDYEETVDSNQGLLTDYINDNISSFGEFDKSKIMELLNFWNEQFTKTVFWSEKPSANDNLFRNRIMDDGRYDKWYSNNKVTIKNNNMYLRELFSYNFIVNNQTHYGTINQIHHEVKKNLLSKKKRVKVLSQGDPLELNIGMKPIFFDFENSGINDFIGESTVFIFGILIDGGYFSPKYHPNAYWLHKNSIDNINNHKYSYLDYSINTIKREIIVNYKLEIPKIRKEILRDYFKIVVKPIIEKVDVNLDDYFKELKYYLFMRSLCVHHPNNMGENDLIFNLTLLFEFYGKGLKYYLKYLEILK